MMRSFCLIVVLAFVAACTPSPSPVLPPKALEPVANSIKIQKLWSKKIDGGASDNYLRLTPVIDGETIYSVDYKGTVTAFDTLSRYPLWQLELGAAGSSPLALADNNLYVGTSEGQLVALAAKDGSPLWRTQLQSEVLAKPVIGNGIVIARCVNGDVIALRQDTGEQLWQIEERTPALTLRGLSTPVIYNDLLLIAFDNGKLKAVVLQTGKQIWETAVAIPRGRSDLERIVDLDSTPVIIDDIVYSIAYQGRVVAIQLGSGQIIWQRDIDSYVDVAIDAYRLYISSADGIVWALDRSNGATLWKQDALLRRGLTAPRIYQDHIVVGDFDGFVHWLRRDSGKLDARIRMLVFDYDSPDLNDPYALVFPKENNILITPIADKNQLILVDRYGHVEAFEVSKR